MARVVVAAEAGACFGVERALRMVRERAHKAMVPVHTLGPLIHNPLVVAELRGEGVDVVKDPEEAAQGDVLFMRTHGVTPETEKRARDCGLEVVDATCPFVKKVHKAVERLADEGYQIVVVGEKGHPEVEGTLGHAPGAVVVGSTGDLEGLSLERRVGVVVQTTLAVQTLREVVSGLVGRCEEIRLIDTICDATSKRQAAAATLATEADVMVVVGGKNSANTTHLADICSKHCKRTYHVESADELDVSMLGGAELIGITAGASTPADHIETARKRIESLVG